MVVAVVLSLYMGDNCSSCRSAIVRCMLCGEGGCGGADPLNVQNFTPTQNFRRKNVRQKVRKFCHNLKCNKNNVFYQIYFNSTVFNIIPDKTAT